MPDTSRKASVAKMADAELDKRSGELLTMIIMAIQSERDPDESTAVCLDFIRGALTIAHSDGIVAALAWSNKEIAKLDPAANGKG